jgi:hypothetical protein
VDWIDLAQDRNRWRALVNSVLDLRVPWDAGKLSSDLTSSGLSAQLSSIELVSYTRNWPVEYKFDAIRIAEANYNSSLYCAGLVCGLTQN